VTLNFVSLFRHFVPYKSCHSDQTSRIIFDTTFLLKFYAFVSKRANPQWIGFLCKKLTNTIDTRVGELYTVSKT